MQNLNNRSLGLSDWKTHIMQLRCHGFHFLCYKPPVLMLGHVGMSAWDGREWSYVEGTFYHSSKQPSFYVKLISRAIYFVCTPTKKIIDFVWMGLDSLLLCEAVRLRRFSTCPVGVAWGLPTQVSSPRDLESSLARESDWWIFLFRDAFLPFLSVPLFYGIRCL